MSPGTDLEDMQSTWYLLEQGDAYNRNRQLALALKKYVAVQKVRLADRASRSTRLTILSGF